MKPEFNILDQIKNLEEAQQQKLLMEEESSLTESIDLTDKKENMVKSTNNVAVDAIISETISIPLSEVA